MASTAQEKVEAAPNVYTLESLPDYWIAEASDSLLYVVHNERGGWRRRCWYPGCPGILKRVHADKAREIVRFVGGYWGAVTIRTTRLVEIQEPDAEQLLPMPIEYASINA